MQKIKLIADLAGTKVHDDRVCYESIAPILKKPEFKRISLEKIKDIVNKFDNLEKHSLILTFTNMIILLRKVCKRLTCILQASLA